CRAVNSGKAQIGDDDVKSEIGQTSQGYFSRFGLLDQVAAVAQLFRDRDSQGRLVLDKQEMFRVLRHLCQRQYLDTIHRGPGSTAGRPASKPCPHFLRVEPCSCSADSPIQFYGGKDSRGTKNNLDHEGL